MNLKIKVVLLVFYLLSGHFTYSFADTFEERKQAVIEYGVAREEHYYKISFWYATAKFKKYEQTADITYLNDALDDVDAGLDDLRNNPETSDISFGLIAAIDCYLRWNQYYTAALKNETKTTLTETDRWSIHGTANKAAMSSAGRYLSSITWPSETFTSNYDSSDPSGKQRILDLCDRYTRLGEREHNSPTYFGFHYLAFRSIADHAPLDDPDNIKEKCRMTADWMLASCATEWFNGHWAAGSERSQVNYCHQWRHQASDHLLWMYFGGKGGRWDLDYEGPFPAMMSAVSEYIPPKIITDIAGERSSQFIHKEAHSLWGSLKNYGTTFMKPPYYAIFNTRYMWKNTSDYKYNHSDHRWKVTWDRPGYEKSSFFLKHQYRDDDRPDMGITWFEQTVQYENTIIGVFNIPADDPIPYAKAWIPAGYDEYKDNSSGGKLKLRYGHVLISLYLTSGFNWNHTTPNQENFTVAAGKMGMVVEVATLDDYASFDEFSTAADAAIATSASLDDVGDPVFTYTNLQGVAMESKIVIDNQGNSNGYDKINGEFVAYDDTWPLLDDPWMHQGYDSDILTITFNGRQRMYDFNNWTIIDDEAEEQKP